MTEEENEVKGDGLYIDVDHTEPQNSDEEIWNSANMLVNHAGYMFQDVVDHLGLPSERIRAVIRKKMAERSDNIKKSYDSGNLTEEEYTDKIDEFRSFSQTIGSLS